MKNYTSKETLIKDANEQLKGYAVYHESFGDGEIEEISGSSLMFAKINFMGNEKLIAVSKAAQRMTHDSNFEVLLDYATAYDALQKAEEDARNKAWWDEYNAKRDAEKKAAQEAKEAKAYEAYVQSANSKARELARTSEGKKIAVDEEEWIMSHVNAVSAQVPDFLDAWFKEKFPEATYRVVDSHRKTSGGYKMKWGLSLTATVKNPETAPSHLQSKMNGNKITDTAYLFGVCMNYGIRIGKSKK